MKYKKKIFFFTSSLGLLKLYHYDKNKEIDTLYKRNELNNFIMDNAKYMKGNFSSCYYFPIRFMSIIWGNLLDKRCNIEYNREIFYTSDKENFALDWVANNNKEKNKKPLVIIFPGVFGTSKAKYIQPLATEINNNGFDCVVINPRGLEIPLIQNDFFSEKVDSDLNDICGYISNLYKNQNVYLVGTSLGSSLSCRYLALSNLPSNIKGHISISNPYDVFNAASISTRWYNFIYGINLAQGMKKSILLNQKRFEEVAKEKNININFTKIKYSWTTFAIDKEFVKKLYPNDYIDSENYYNKLSCHKLIKDINIPCLLINSNDDPISHKSFVPVNDISKKENIILLRTHKGGHVEFLTGFNAERWYTKASSEYLKLLESYNQQNA